MFNTQTNEDTLLKEICNGYGFTEIPQEAEGIYCDGCLTIHKRPTKMYSQYPNKLNLKAYCYFAVIYFYND